MRDDSSADCVIYERKLGYASLKRADHGSSVVHILKMFDESYENNKMELFNLFILAGDITLFVILYSNTSS